jgi:YegS/Rv2252/BmrU family lipid kinase
MLVNPNARRGAEALAVVDKLEAAGMEVCLERYASPAEAASDISRRADGFDLAIVCGGDGTIASVAKSLLEVQLPLGVLPLGTANDLARTLGIPTDLEQAAEVIVRGRTERVDVGEVNGHAFFNVASLGLSAELARGLTRESKRRWGRLAYAVRAAQVLFRARPFRADIIEDGHRTRVRTLQIAVGNGRHYGGGSVIHEHASILDGQLDLYSLDPQALWKVALFFPVFRQGRHWAWDEVRACRSTEFEIQTRRRRPINVDGDIVTHTPAKFIVRPAALEVFVPEAQSSMTA